MNKNQRNAERCTMAFLLQRLPRMPDRASINSTQKTPKDIPRPNGIHPFRARKILPTNNSKRLKNTQNEKQTPEHSLANSKHREITQKQRRLTGGMLLFPRTTQKTTSNSPRKEHAKTAQGGRPRHPQTIQTNNIHEPREENISNTQEEHPKPTQ